MVNGKATHSYTHSHSLHDHFTKSPNSKVSPSSEKSQNLKNEKSWRNILMEMLIKGEHTNINNIETNTCRKKERRGKESCSFCTKPSPFAFRHVKCIKEKKCTPTPPFYSNIVNKE